MYTYVLYGYKYIYIHIYSWVFDLNAREESPPQTSRSFAGHKPQGHTGLFLQSVLWLTPRTA